MIGFAHRGAKAYARENTLEAFALALRLGADGLESDVWLTEDGIAVLDHDGVVRGRLRARPIRELRASALPAHIPTLAALLASLPSNVALSLDVKDPSAFATVLGTYRLHRQHQDNFLYLCHPDAALLAGQRELAGDVNLVHSSRLARMTDGPERHAAQLREYGIDVVNMPYSDWTGGLVALFRRFGIGCFAWDCQHERQIVEVRNMGVDAVFSDWPDRLADVLRGGH